MTAQRRYHLGQLTALSLPPHKLLPMAAAAGYDGVSVRMLASTPGGAEYPLAPGSSALREVKRILGDTGVYVHDVEALQLDERFSPDRFARTFEAAGELGARSMLVVCDDPDLSRAATSFALLCEALVPYGMEADLEFIPTRTVARARDALRVVGTAGQPNGGVVVDAIHVARTESPLSDIAAIPHRMLHFWQICDAPAETPETMEEILFAGRHERLLPGEGGLDLVGLASLMPEAAAICVEIPTTTRRSRGDAAWIALTLERSRAFMAELDATKDGAEQAAPLSLS